MLLEMQNVTLTKHPCSLLLMLNTLKYIDDIIVILMKYNNVANDTFFRV